MLLKTEPRDRILSLKFTAMELFPTCSMKKWTTESTSVASSHTTRLEAWVCLTRNYMVKVHFTNFDANSKTHKWKSWYKSLQGFYRNFEYFLLFAIHINHYFNRLCACSALLYEKKKSVVWLEHQVILTYIITFIIYLYRLDSILSGLDSPNWIIRDLGSPKSVDPTSRVLIQKEQLFVTPLLIFILLYFTMRIRRLKLLAHNLIFRRHTTLFE